MNINYDPMFQNLMYTYNVLFFHIFISVQLFKGGIQKIQKRKNLKIDYKNNIH